MGGAGGTLSLAPPSKELGAAGAGTGGPSARPINKLPACALRLGQDAQKGIATPTSAVACSRNGTSRTTPLFQPGATEDAFRARVDAEGGPGLAEKEWMIRWAIDPDANPDDDPNPDDGPNPDYNPNA